jgi:hypothetical protein
VKMSEGACISFQQHAWKTDMCANCLKAKSWHEANIASPRPMPAKRQPRESSAILSKANDTRGSVVVASDSIENSFKSENNVTSIGNSERNVICKESIGASTTTKPSPMKAKPAIGSKPMMSQKPVGIIKEDLEVLRSKCSSSMQLPRKVLSSEKSENVPNFDENGDDRQVCDFGECNASDRIVQRISDRAMPSIDDHSLEKQTSHYYQVYDITGRNEVAVTSTSGNESNVSAKASRIAGNTRVPAMQIVEVAEEQIAMPYNVVDVTIRRPDASGCLPQLPKTPAPSNFVSQSVSTCPVTSIHCPTSKNSPVPRQRTAKDAMEQSKAFDHRTENDSSPVNSSPDLNSDRYAHRIYEDIDDRITIGEISSLSDRSVQINGGKTTVPKSAAFEARVAALSSLDLVKQPCHQKQLQTVCATSTESDQSADSESVKFDTQLMLPSNKKSSEGVGVDSLKPDKSRKKESGKSFFHKLLRLGSKEGSKEVKEVKDDAMISENTTNVLPIIGDAYENVSCTNHEGSLSNSAETSGSELTSTTTSVCQTRVATSEKQVVLLDLKDCLVKRQMTSNKPGSESSPIIGSCSENSQFSKGNHVDSLEHSANDRFIKIDKMASSNEFASNELHTRTQEMQPNLACADQMPTLTIVRACDEEKQQCSSHQVNLTCATVEEVKLLTVDTDGMQLTDNFASPCSSSDAVSPTPSDQFAEGAADHRRRSKADMNPSEAFVFEIVHKHKHTIYS